MSAVFRSFAFLFLAGFLLASPVYAQVPSQRPGRVEVGLGTMRVNVRNATGAPLDTQATIVLRQRVGSIQVTQNTMEAASAEFRGLPVGDYVIEVSAAGYQPATEEATLFSATSVSHVFVHLLPLTAPGATVASGPPLLAPKAQKEIQDAIQAMERSDLDEAQKRLERAEKLAPGHPEVHYLWGMLNLRRNDLAAARQRFEKAISIYPQHVPALGALGRLLFQQGDLTGAAAALERALVVDSRSRDNHAFMAAVLFQQKQMEKARYHAEQALDIAQNKLPETRLLLAQILAAQGESAKAADVLTAFLADYPAHSDADAARRMLAELRSGGRPAEAGDQDGTGNPAGGETKPQGVKVTRAGARVLALASLTPELAPGAMAPTAREWAPKDVDDQPPAVFRDVTCSAQQVVERAGRRVMDLAKNLRDVNAQESVTHTEIDSLGRPGRSESRSYEYMFSIRRGEPNLLWVEEFRNGQLGDNNFIGSVHTMGVTALALIFHPAYASDFEMTCEGQGSWRGEPVWYVHFRQRDDKPSRFYVVRHERGATGVPLKGRAWIAANSHQIVRLELGLVAPMPDLRLDREQLVIEYGPVTFKERKQTYWLPSSADIYAQMRGKRYHRRHALMHYVHFAVDTKQKITDPDVPHPPPSPPFGTKPPL